ncbi:hypothetical protein [Malaciobacter canalis]|uniref:hypothetical protein n=1 Tax=Malaciobacter canalis TaxID=1912871 RepID=UPI00384F54EC
MDLNKELETLFEKYKKIEQKSLKIDMVPDNKFLVVRLDGFKVTKNYLKDVVINKKLTNAMNCSINELFKRFRTYFTNEYSSSIIGTFYANDEVSIILSNKMNLSKDTYGRNLEIKRVMKVCTIFAGAISSFMTEKMDEVLYFDARPIILNQNELGEYIYSRQLVASRYAYWKILRLNDIKGWEKDFYKKNLLNSKNKVKDIGKLPDANNIINSYSFNIINDNLKAILVSYNLFEKYNNKDEIQKIIDKKITTITKSREKIMKT